jgi:PAS domain S-box-containing protein
LPKLSKTALVVDNDFFFVKFITQLLEERGYDVIKAYDGKEGLSKLEQMSFDCIFVDMVLPKIDGEKFIGVVRNRFPEAPFPIIALGENIIEQIDQIGRIQADYYIAKGTLENMTDSLSRFIDKIQEWPLQARKGESLLESGKLYPRRIVGELMDVVRFRQAVMESVPMGIAVVDTDGKVIEANGAALTIWDRPMDKVLNRPLTDLFPSQTREELTGALDRLSHGEEPSEAVLSVPMGSQGSLMVLSALRINDDMKGWVMAMIGLERLKGLDQ